MGDRVFAVILDTIVLFPLFWLLMACVAISYGLYRNGNATMNGGPALLAISGITGFWILYYTVGEGWFAGTPGKHVMGIEVLTDRRAPISLSQAVIRNLLRPIDAIGVYLLGFLVAVFSKQGQRIGDFAANTIVCEKENGRRRLAALVWAGFLAAGFLADSLLFHLARTR